MTTATHSYPYSTATEELTEYEFACMMQPIAEKIHYYKKTNTQIDIVVGNQQSISGNTTEYATFAYENRGLKSQTGQWTTALGLYDRAYGYDKLNRYRSSTPGANDKFGAEAQNLDQFESRLGEAYVDGETIQYALSGSRNQYASASGPALLGNKRGSRMFENAGQWQFTNINFQCAVSAAPKGFSDDRGHLYGARNGEVYGWSVDNFNGIYHPHENAPTPAHQSYNTLVNGLSWEIEVANGTYFVELVAGTPIDETSRHIVNVEGIAFLDGTAAPGKTYITAMREVSVTDGKLTLTDGGSDNGGAQIVYIRIGKQLPSNGVLPEPTEETIIHHPVGAREEDGTFQYSWNLVDVTPNELTNKLYDPASPTKPVPARSKNIYDATGRRVAVVYFGQDGSSVFKSTRFVYNGVNIIEEKSLDGNTTFKKHFYEGVNRPIVTEDVVAGQRYVAITDDRGTLMGVANDSGQILEQIHYNSSGLMKVHDGTGVAKVDSVGNNIGRSELMPFGWTGYYKDDFSGFYLTLYRWFDPLHNRWLSEDPAGHMDGLNLYAAYMGVNGEDEVGLGLPLVIGGIILKELIKKGVKEFAKSQAKKRVVTTVINQTAKGSLKGKKIDKTIRTKPSPKPKPKPKPIPKRTFKPKVTEEVLTSAALVDDNEDYTPGSDIELVTELDPDEVKNKPGIAVKTVEETTYSKVNMDTSAIFTLIAGDPIDAMATTTAIVGKKMVITEAAIRETNAILARHGSLQAKAKFALLLTKMTKVPNTPSYRVTALAFSKSKTLMNPFDRLIFGTGDALGIPTVTGDPKFFRSAAKQGVLLDIIVVPPTSKSRLKYVQ